jgi:hypothetical protein
MFFRILIAQIIHPVDKDFISWLAAFQMKCKIRIFGNTGTHIAGGNNFAVVLNRQHLNVMGRDKLIGGKVLVPAMFHRMGNKGSYLGVTVQPFRTYFDAGHANLRTHRW